MARRKRRTMRRTTRRMKSKLAGYTRTAGKYALVFKKGKKLAVGKGRFKTKASLAAAAKKYLK